MSSNYHFHKLNVASSEYQINPATPITNTIQCKLCVTSEITVYFFTCYLMAITLQEIVANLTNSQIFLSQRPTIQISRKIFGQIILTIY